MSPLDDTRVDPAQAICPTPTGSNRELQRLGRFRLLRLLGEGGMGVVYLAYHPKMKKQVALKVLAEQFSQNQNFIDRFYREAKSGALLNHPNIVRSHGVGQDKTTHLHYLVLEHVDGPSAMQLLNEKGRLSVADTVRITYDVACALEHAHSRNVIHRDIKPDNILITRGGAAKLADLGLAKRTDEVSHLTAARQAFGTPHYMPYEQAINARRADHRSDIYALGATAYHLITGEVPFPGETPLDVVEKKELGDLIPASQLCNVIPQELDRVLLKMMARHPRDRYQTASELIVDLERSSLVAPLLSFVDPALALRDPDVRARAALAQSQPTQPDLGQALAQEAAARADKGKSPDERIWLVRYKVEQGRWRKLQLTQPQLEHRLRKQRIPMHAEVCRNRRQGFIPLQEHEELKELVRQLEKSQKAIAAKSAKPKPRAPEAELNANSNPERSGSRRRKLGKRLLLLSTIVGLTALSILVWNIS